MPQEANLYAQAIAVGKDFLGPAGERFMRRQITTHLGITPEALHSRDLPELVDWVRLTFALLTNDARHVDAFANQLLALSKEPMQNARGTRHGNPA